MCKCFAIMYNSEKKKKKKKWRRKETTKYPIKCVFIHKRSQLNIKSKCCTCYTWSYSFRNRCRYCKIWGDHVPYLGAIASLAQNWNTHTNTHTHVRAREKLPFLYKLKWKYLTALIVEKSTFIVVSGMWNLIVSVPDHSSYTFIFKTDTPCRCSRYLVYKWKRFRWTKLIKRN